MTTQYVTLDEAKKIAKQIGEIGGGVLPYNPETVDEYAAPLQDDDPNRSGIYIPSYIGGPFATPSNGDAKFFHFRFVNGAEGFNAGLIKATMAYSPTRWPLMLALEVEAAKKH